MQIGREPMHPAGVNVHSTRSFISGIRHHQVKSIVFMQA